MDVICSHCAEPWDVYGLRHDSIGYLDDGDGPLLAPLGEQLPALFDLFWSLDSDPDDPAVKEAARTVQEAIHRAVLSGKGCPSSDCGFHHTAPGKHRETTLRQIVFDGVTDEDPAQFFD